jgi:hypothetical protein
MKQISGAPTILIQYIGREASRRISRRNNNSNRILFFEPISFFFGVGYWVLGVGTIA